ncbi:hypothetical protein BsWGS_25566 [Bradybaena similaris]
MTDMSEERRSAKLHKQTEVEDDDAGDDASGMPEPNPLVANTPTASAGIPTPTVQSASSSSGTSPDESQPKVVVPPPMTRKQTLSRGIALEGTSPPPESFFSQIPPKETVQDSRLWTNGATGGSADKSAGKKRGQSHEAKEFLLASHKISNDSGHGTMDHNDGASDTSVLSRDSSLENASIKDVYRDTSGADIPQFMKETLTKSAKDKKTILQYEDQLLNFINSDSSQTYKMAEMTSYDRMIVHRLAAFLGLEHNVDSTGKCVVLSRTENTRSVKLSDLVFFEDAEQEPKKKILLKKPQSLDEKHGRLGKVPFASIRAKSLEERQQIYIEARERIFNKNDEMQLEGASAAPNLLTANYMPQIHHQRSLDSTRSSSQLSTRWVSTESSGYESLKDSPNTHYGSPPMPQAGCQVPVAFPSDHSHISRSTTDVSPSPLSQLQPHINADGTLYHFDPTCPPPFMVQPQTQPPPGQIVYQTDNISDLTARLAASSLGGTLDQGGEHYPGATPGQAIPVVPTVIPHIQSVYTSPSQFAQGQYFAAPSPAGQQQIRYVTFSYPQGQGQQLLQPAPVDGQGQTTVPMPAVGVPAVPGAGGYQVVGSPYQQALAGASPAHCVEFSPTAYHYGAVPDTVMVSRTGSMSTSATMTAPGTPHYILTYSQPQPTQQQQQPQHTILPSHPTQYTPAGNAPPGTFYTVPVSTPTPPLTLSQPPPSSHHHHQQQQQHQPAVFYTTSIGNPLTYPVAPSNPLSSTCTLKTIPTSFIQTQYRPSTPPQQQQQQFHHHPQQSHHHPQQPQTTMIASSNGHHPAPLTLNYSHTVPFNPGQPVAAIPAAQGSQLVAFQPNSFQVRPVGTALIQVASSPVLQAPQPGPQVQPYHILKPAGSLSDIRMVSPSSVRPRLSSIQLTSPTSQQPRLKSSNQYRQNKKGSKKFSSSRDVEDDQGVQGIISPQQTGHISIMAPHSLPSPTAQPLSHIPSSFSNRQ